MTDEPSARILAIEKSLRAFVCGILGAVPVLGFVPAAYALACWLTVRHRQRDQWNPASEYLAAGLVLAVFGLASSALLILIVLAGIARELFG